MLSPISFEIPVAGLRLRSAIPSFVNLAQGIRITLAATLFLLCASCADLEQNPYGNAAAVSSERLQTALESPQPEPAYWDEAEVTGTPKIVVRLDEQRAYFYKGKKVVGESSISTGRDGFDTPPGKYRVIQKDEDHFSTLYGNYVDETGAIVQENVDIEKDPRPEGAQFAGAPMAYFLRFTRGYGMHAGFVPKYRASHGCIRMPREMAKHFFEAAELDTPVVVEE